MLSLLTVCQGAPKDMINWLGLAGPTAGRWTCGAHAALPDGNPMSVVSGGVASYCQCY